jgi:hypothetical protein
MQAKQDTTQRKAELSLDVIGYLKVIPWIKWDYSRCMGDISDMVEYNS